MTHRRYPWGLACCVGLSCILSACGPDGRRSRGGSDASGAGNVSAGAALGQALVFDLPVEVVDGDLPEGQTSGPQVISLPGEEDPTPLRPGDAVTFVVPWSGGEITTVNLSLTPGTFFSVPVPAARGRESGQVVIPAQIGADVCASLSDICHQIQCYEQVETPSGTVSVAAARQMVLDCTGGAGCTGQPPGGQPPQGKVILTGEWEGSGCDSGGGDTRGTVRAGFTDTFFSATYDGAESGSFSGTWPGKSFEAGGFGSMGGCVWEVSLYGEPPNVMQVYGGFSCETSDNQVCFGVWCAGAPGYECGVE